MRYLKVLLAIIFFYFVMLFFVQNQESLSQTLPLKLDLMFIPPVESMPLSFYTLALISFLLGGVVVLTMLVWDRLSCSAQLSGSKRRMRSLEKELQKAYDANDAVKKELQEAILRAETAEKSRFAQASLPEDIR